MTIRRDADGGFFIPTEHVNWHTLFEGTDEIPFAFHVFVLDDLTSVRALADEQPDGAYARTFLYDEPDDNGAIGAIYFAAGWVYVGMVAHESLHLASWMLKTVGTDLGAIGAESEALADLIGILTSVVWYNVELAGHATVDETDDEAGR